MKMIGDKSRDPSVASLLGIKIAHTRFLHPLILSHRELRFNLFNGFDDDRNYD